MFSVILLCLLTCCSSFMPLKHSESIISEDHTQVVDSKSKRNYLGGDEVNYFTASDFLANSFGEVFYKEVGDLQAPATSNLPYTARTTNTIEYNYESDSVFGWAVQGGFGNNLLNDNLLSVVTANNQLICDGLSLNLPIGDYSLINYDSTLLSCNISVSGGGGVFTGVTPNSTINFSITNEVNAISIRAINISTSTKGQFMLNVGSSSLPYEPYFIGGYPSTNTSYPIRFLDIKKEYFVNSINNTYMYHYTMDFSASRPGVGKTRIFSVITDIMPEIKRVDTQGNLWPGGFWSYTYIDLNRTYYDIPLNSFMYGESSASGQLAPILNKYIRNLTYGDSYQGGYDAGYDNGYNVGNNYGYQRGYSQGVSDAIAGGSQAMTIFAGIMDVAFIPVNVFFLMFDYEVFGINIAGFVSGLITIAIVIILMRFIFGRKV